MRKQNKPWLGPDLEEMAAAFVTAFVGPSLALTPTLYPPGTSSQREREKREKREGGSVYFDFLAGRPLPLEAFGVKKKEADDGSNLA
jgi:hypothetical protein